MRIYRKYHTLHCVGYLGKQVLSLRGHINDGNKHEVKEKGMKVIFVNSQELDGH